MEEDIKVIEEYLKQYKRQLENYGKDNCLTSVYYELKKYAQALEHLIKTYKDLKEIEESHRKENGELREKIKELEEEIKKINQQLDLDYVDKNFIPISFVEAKIEEIDKEYRKILCKEGMSADKYDKLNKLEIETEVLEELLEKRK